MSHANLPLSIIVEGHPSEGLVVHKPCPEKTLNADPDKWSLVVDALKDFFKIGIRGNRATSLKAIQASGSSLDDLDQLYQRLHPSIRNAVREIIGLATKHKSTVINSSDKRPESLSILGFNTKKRTLILPYEKCDLDFVEPEVAVKVAEEPQILLQSQLKTFLEEVKIKLNAAVVAVDSPYNLLFLGQPPTTAHTFYYDSVRRTVLISEKLLTQLLNSKHPEDRELLKLIFKRAARSVALYSLIDVDKVNNEKLRLRTIAQLRFANNEISAEEWTDAYQENNALLERLFSLDQEDLDVCKNQSGEVERINSIIHTTLEELGERPRYGIEGRFWALLPEIDKLISIVERSNHQSFSIDELLKTKLTILIRAQCADPQGGSPFQIQGMKILALAHDRDLVGCRQAVSKFLLLPYRDAPIYEEKKRDALGFDLNLFVGDEDLMEYQRKSVIRWFEERGGRLKKQLMSVLNRIYMDADPSSSSVTGRIIAGISRDFEKLAIMLNAKNRFSSMVSVIGKICALNINGIIQTSRNLTLELGFQDETDAKIIVAMVFDEDDHFLSVSCPADGLNDAQMSELRKARGVVKWFAKNLKLQFEAH